MGKKLLRTFGCLGAFKRRRRAGKQQPVSPLRIEGRDDPEPHSLSTEGDNGATASTENFDDKYRSSRGKLCCLTFFFSYGSSFKSSNNEQAF